MAYETILVERRGAVGLITLNRPKALNALNAQLIAEIEAALDRARRRRRRSAPWCSPARTRRSPPAPTSRRWSAKDFTEAFAERLHRPLGKIGAAPQAVIAAVAGFALGGGCELAMMCDLILAADNAQVRPARDQPRHHPGAGGTQRLTRAVGKAKAMEMVLTGRMMEAAEAERAGLVARVVPVADLVDEAVKLGETIAAKSRPIVAMAKDAVNAAYETSLAEGLKFERRLFYATFATDDRREGMTAFVEKRSPNFTDR